MTYKMQFNDNENGVKVETEKKTFKTLITFIKEYLLNGSYTLANCSITIERVDRYGSIEILANGSGNELLDLVRVADFGLD